MKCYKIETYFPSCGLGYTSYFYANNRKEYDDKIKLFTNTDIYLVAEESGISEEQLKAEIIVTVKED